MTSLPDIELNVDYQDESAAAEDKVSAANLDSDHGAIREWINDRLLPMLARVIRDDDTLVDSIVRARNLHPEISALIASRDGWLPKLPVACATTANIALTGEQTIDGVLTSASRVLVKNQTDASENGIYVSAAGAWARATDADTAADLGHAFVSASGGSTQISASWVLAEVAEDITVDTTDLTWVQMGGLIGITPIAKGGTGASTAGDALTNLGFSAYVQTIINDVDAAAVRATLGFSTFGGQLGDDADAATARATLGGLTRVVATLAALKALATTDLAGTVLVEGYAAAGDGGGGLWRWASADTSTANNGTIVQPDAGGVGRWNRISPFQTVVNAAWFGALGDGATDDTTALLAAIAAIPAGGGTLYIPPTSSHYLISAGLDFGSRSRVRVVSSGATIKCDAAMADTQYSTYPDLGKESVIRFVDASDIIVEGLTLDGNLANRTAHAVTESYNSAIMLGGCSRVRLLGCRFINGLTDGISVRNGAAGAISTDVIMRDCVCDANRRLGLALVSVDGFLAERCRFDNQPSTGVSPKSGVDCEPNVATDRMRNVRFTDCSADGNASRGFFLQLNDMDSTSDDVDIVFQNCRAKGNLHGFYCQGVQDGSVGRVRFEGCYSIENGYNGFKDLDCHYNGIRRDYVGCTSIDDNTIGATSVSTGFACGFYVRASDTTDVGNAHFLDCVTIDHNATPKLRRGFALYTDGAGGVVRKCQVINPRIEGATANSFVGFTIAPLEQHATNLEVDIIDAVAYESANTVNASVIARHSGTTHNNTGAVGSITLTLPDATVGLRFRFRVTAAQTMKVTVTAGDQIVPIASAVDRSLSSNVLGNLLAVECKVAGFWQITEIVGTWTDGAI